MVCNWVGTRSSFLALLIVMTGAVCYRRAE
jgi:hypothetical protein